MPIHPEDVLTLGRNLKLSKGEWAGQPMTIYPYQENLTRDVFRLDPTGNRKHNTALIGMARKNAKTKTAAWWALAGLLEEPGGEVIGAAAKRDQARILLDAAKDFVKASSFNGRPLTDWFKPKRNAIYCPSMDSVYKVISADADKEHGLNPHMVLADEVHAWKGEAGQELWEALDTALGARKNPLIIAITTAGEPEGIWHRLYQKGRAIERGVRRDPSFLFRWWEADRDLAIDDPEAWKQANPGLDVIKKRDYMARQAAEALDPQGTITEYAFRRLHLNQPTSAAERWVPYQAWQACVRLTPDIPEDAEVYLGVDAALKRDTFAVSMVHLDDRDPPHMHVKTKAFTPDDEDGYIDPMDVYHYVFGLANTYRVQEVRYDPAYMGLLPAKLEDRGVPMEPHRQTAAPMARASERLQRFILDERLRVGGDRGLDEQMAQVGVRMNDQGVRITKKKSGGHVDRVVATAMAVDAAVEDKLEGMENVFVTVG